MPLKTDTFEPLREAMGATNETRIINEIYNLLRENVQPYRIAGWAAIMLLERGGFSNPYALAGTMAAGQLAWTPPPTTPLLHIAEQTLLLAQAILYLLSQTRAEAHPKLTPLPPAEINHPGGSSGALIEAVQKGDSKRTEEILLGQFGTGADYKATMARLYRAMGDPFPLGPELLIFAHAGSSLMSVTGWQIYSPLMFGWLVEQMKPTSDQYLFLDELHAFFKVVAPELLPWSKRDLSNPVEDAAGFQKLLLDGKPGEVLKSIATQLKKGTNPHAIASVIALAAAERILRAPTERLARSITGLLFLNAARYGLKHIRTDDILWLLFTSAVYVNALKDGDGEAVRVAPGKPTGEPAPALLENLRRNLQDRQIEQALAVTASYVAGGYSSAALVAELARGAGSVDGNAEWNEGRAMALTQAVHEEVQALGTLGNPTPLLQASARYIAELPQKNQVTQQIVEVLSNR